jgi:MFS family permease
MSENVDSRVAGDARWVGNLRKIYLYQGCTNLMLFMPVWIIFMQTGQGLTLTQVTVMLGASWFVSALAEVPSGALADTIGRRATLLLGTALVAGGTALVAVLDGYWLILAAYLVWSVGLALQSGADMALLYDSLRLAGREAEYEQAAGRSFAIIQLAQGVSSVAGGLLAVVALSLPLLATSVLTAVGLVFLALLREPPPEHTGRPSYRGTLATAARVVRQHRGLRPLMLFSAALGVVPWLLVFVLFQPYLNGESVPIAWFGALFLVLRLAGVAGSRLGPRVIARSARPAWLTAVPLLFAGLFALMAVLPLWGAVFALMLVVGFLQGCLRPVLSDLLNQRIAAGVRATVLSLQSLLLTLAIAVLQPAAGLVADLSSPAGAFLLLAVVALVAAALRQVWRRSEGPAAATEPVTADRTAGSGR